MPVAVDRDVSPLTTLGFNSEDAQLLTNTHANVLIVGLPEDHDAILSAVVPLVREPLRVLRDVELLNSAEQRDLLVWLDEAGEGTRVISLTSAGLYPLVEHGAFLDALYYRLNVLRVDLI
jgi:hypothetical protein